MRKINQPIKLLRVLLIACLALNTACGSLRYYGQSLAGQLDLMRRQQPVDCILNDPAAEPELKQKLARIQAILNYAHTELALPDNGSYRQYAEIGRDYVVWNVFAAPEFSLQARQWCYPFIGCAGYRGYFRREAAIAHARKLQQDGWETSVNGVSAYSTLGWLRDPLLNTILNREDWEIARLLFHELAHQRLYVRGDTDFNEAFADAVALIGLRIWIRRHAADRLGTIEATLNREERLNSLLLDARDRFDALYRSGLPETAMRKHKAELREQLWRDWQELKRQQVDDNHYDGWLRGINNASLAAVSAYRLLVPAFLAAFHYHGESLPRLYDWAAGLMQCTKSARLDLLKHPDQPVSCSDP